MNSDTISLTLLSVYVQPYSTTHLQRIQLSLLQQTLGNALGASRLPVPKRRTRSCTALGTKRLSLAGRGCWQVKLLCFHFVLSRNKGHCCFEDSPLESPFVSPRPRGTSQPARSTPGMCAAAVTPQHLPTALMFPATSADRYFCTKICFLMLSDYHKRSQSICEVWENTDTIQSSLSVVCSPIKNGHFYFSFIITSRLFCLKHIFVSLPGT